MRLHVLVEGPSEEALLSLWLPRFLGPAHPYKIITHQGKGKLAKDLLAKPDPKHRGLLDQLPAKLRAYGKTLNSDLDRLVVLVDADDENCVTLLANLAKAVKACKPAPIVLFRVAIEETEAFYLGDSAAIKRAYPSAKIGKLKHHAYDSICGTWELFREVIGEGDDSEDKVAWAESMGSHLGIKWQGIRGVNRSPSFRKFCEGLRKICGDT